MREAPGQRRPFFEAAHTQQVEEQAGLNLVRPVRGRPAEGPGAQRTRPRARKARLWVAVADPWSVMKMSFLLSMASAVYMVATVAVLWMAMDAIDVFSTVGDAIKQAHSSFDLRSYLSLPRVLTFTSSIAALGVVLATALATLGSFVYNLSARFVDGVELTLAEDA